MYYVLENRCSTLFPILDGLPDGFTAWYKKAYKDETEVVERPSLMCNVTYFQVYLVWMNFFIKFALPTIVLIGCNIKILQEVIRYS